MLDCARVAAGSSRSDLLTLEEADPQTLFSREGSGGNADNSAAYDRDVDLVRGQFDLSSGPQVDSLPAADWGIKESSMDVLDRLDQMIDERHLLKHPFYTKWAEGTLPHRSAAGVRAPVLRVRVGHAALPVGAPHAHRRQGRAPADPRQPVGRGARQGQPRRAVAALRGGHRRVARGRSVGARRTRPPRRSSTCTPSHERRAGREPASRRSTPTSARCRRSPARRSTGWRSTTAITDDRALKFFVVHGVLDIEHSGAEREMLGELAADADPEPIEEATRRALEAWWNFLSAVDQPCRGRRRSRTEKPRASRSGTGGRRVDGSSEPLPAPAGALPRPAVHCGE